MPEINPYQAPQTAAFSVAPAGTPGMSSNAWEEPTRSKILKVAQSQRWVNIHFLIGIVGGILAVFIMPPDSPQQANRGPGIGLIALFVLLIPNALCLIYRLYQLASSLEYTLAILIALCAFLGIIGLIVIVMVSSKATTYLKTFGIPVGFLGVPQATVLQWLDQLQATATARPNTYGGGLPVAQSVPPQQPYR